MARIWNPSARRVLNGISLAMLSMVPGHAIVIHSGSSPAEKARMEARSHAAGMKHTFVVGIEIDALMDGEATESCSIATGVYLGESGDGTKGLTQV